MKKLLIAIVAFLLLTGQMCVPPKASAATGLKFKSVYAGYNTTVALDNDGHIWAWGSNGSGQFGNGTMTGSSTPRRIDVTDGGTPVTFQDVKTGWSGSTALDTSGHLWWTGDAVQNQYGGPMPGSLSWTKLLVSDGGTDVKFTAMARGRFTTFAIDSRDGSIWGWGRGIGDAPEKKPVTDGGSPVAFKQISDSNEDAIALDTSNRIWNLYSVGLVQSKYVLNDGGGAPVHFQSISTGNGSESSYMLHAAVDDDGQVWTWGENESGQLGEGGTSYDGTPKRRTIQDGVALATFDSVSAGDKFVLGLDTNGDIWSWGLNDQGQLGNGTKDNGSPGKLTVTEGGTRVLFKSVAAGYGWSYAIDTDGRIWTWGSGTLAPVKLKFAPSAMLSVSPTSSSTKLQSVTLTAAVTGDWEMPTGTVEFKDGTASLASDVPLIDGIATWTTTSLSVGPHSFSAHFSGDGSYTSQVSATVSYQVNMPAAPALTLTPSTTSDTFDPVTVNISALVNGSGNSLSLLKWLPGNMRASDFAGSGTDVTVAKAFDAASNGTYTVYAKDLAGNETVKTINMTNILPAGNATALNAAIATAEQTLADHPEGTGVGQAPANARNALQTAIDTAKAISDDAAHQLQAQLDAATATLNAAISAFNGAVIEAGNATALNVAIVTAEQALADHSEGTGVGQAPANARNVLQTAIDTAKAISGDAAHQLQAQLDAATSTLNGAIATFNGAVIGAGDAAALNAAIATAEQTLADHPEGTGVGQAPANARNALQTAIDTAKAISDDAESQTQAQLDAATSTLNDAITTFNGAVIGAGDAAALNAAIATAEQTLADHPEGTGVGQAPANARNVMQTAIDAAKAVLDDSANRTQAQLDSATATLNTAIAAFNGAVIGAGDAAALNAAIATAEQTLADHPEGTGVGQAPANARDVLQTAIDTAKAISDDAESQTQAQLDAATATLNAAIAAFNGAVIGAGDAAALDAAIATAEQTLADHPEGTGVGQAPANARNALQTAIEAAKAVSVDAANQSQTQLDAATATLKDAIAAFELTVVGVVLDVPEPGLYGTNAELVFTLTYREPVSVAGTPRLPIVAGTGSVTQSVYAIYTGATGQPTKTLTFSYSLPPGMADVEGIQPASQLELPDGAGVTFSSDGTQAPLSFGVPDTSGIRLIGVAPQLELAETLASSFEAKVTVTATVYGANTAGNSLAKLNWMTGTRSVSDFANGAVGTSILDSRSFAVTENGPYTVYARDAAGNEAVKTTTISAISTQPDVPSGPQTTIETSPGGELLVRIAPSDIVKEIQADGTVIDKIVLSDYLMDQIRDKLAKIELPEIVLAIDDKEQTAKIEFSAEKLRLLQDSFPGVLFESRLNGSSIQLQASVLDLADLASQLQVDLKNMKVNMWASKVAGSTRTELERLAGAKGMKLIGQAVDFRITVSTGSRSLEVKDFGGTYMARAIVLEDIKEGGSYTAVVYDPGASSLSFIPAVIGTRGDNKKEMSMRSPHNSIYAIMETTKRSFDDLNGHWAKDDVELLAVKQIVQGVSDIRFAPNGKITRAEFLALLVRAMGLKTAADPTAPAFADVPANAWFAPEVAAGVKAGLASGVTEERFDPNAQVTREQMALMLANALTLAEGTENAAGSNGASFSDEERISPWARSAADRIAAAGIIRGTADGRMQPEAFATRAEAAATLRRLLVVLEFIDR